MNVYYKSNQKVQRLIVEVRQPIKQTREPNTLTGYADGEDIVRHFKET